MSEFNSFYAASDLLGDDVADLGGNLADFISVGDGLLPTQIGLDELDNLSKSWVNRIARTAMHKGEPGESLASFANTNRALLIARLEERNEFREAWGALESGIRDAVSLDEYIRLTQADRDNIKSLFETHSQYIPALAARGKSLGYLLSRDHLQRSVLIDIIS